MKVLLILLTTFSTLAFAQVDSIAVIRETKEFQVDLNKGYKDRSSSPLKPADLRKFKHHEFFSIDLNYAVIAKLTLTPDTEFKSMPATGSIINEYRSYAIAEFDLNGQPCRLTLYQSKSLMNNPLYRDYLFLPFTDQTTGNESYGGGRYLGLTIPKDKDTILINFNLAYNPYCAYNDKYSCPLVPKENDLPVAVKAGVKFNSH